MAQDLTIVTYGNGDILREVFNAIAASVGDTSYKTLIHLTLAIAGAWVLFQYLTQRHLMVAVKWIGLYFLAFYIVFLPKVTVNIVDRVQQSKVYTVDNIPLGLGILASYTSIIGDGLTQLMEKTFSMPDDLHYGQSGMVMASNLVTASTTFQITDPVFQENMQDFINQCVFYDLLLNKYSAQDLISTSNIWQLVSQNASPARAFKYNNHIVTCKAGVQSLTQDWTTAVDQSADRYGSRLFPNQTQAKAALLQYLPISYGYLTNLSDSAGSLIQQNMMANAIQNGILGWTARSNAPAALESYAFNKAQQQTRIGNRTVGDMAAYWLPLMKNLFEGILYGSFVFTFLLLLFPFGGMVLRNYIYSLLWVQLWAPLYAVINLYVGFYAQHRSMGAINMGGSLSGLSLSTQSGLAQVNADMAGLAGYISISVPILASSLVYGLHKGFGHIAQYIGGTLHSGATSLASETASGNLSLSNSSLHTHSANTMSANNFDTTARTASGMITNQMPSGSTLTMTQNGSMVMNSQGALSNLGTTINLASAIRASAQEQGDMATSSAMSHQLAYSEAMSEARRDAYELSKQEGKTQASGQSYSSSVTAGESHTINTLDQQNQNLSHDHSASESAAANRSINTTADAQVKVGVSTPFASASVSAGINDTHGHTLNQSEQRTYSDNESMQHHDNHSRTVDQVLRDVQEGNYRATTEEGKRLVENISTSLDRAHQEQTQAAVQFQQAETYHHISSIAAEKSASINSNATQEFAQYLQKSGHSAREIENITVNHPEQAEALAESFTQSKTQAFMQEFAKQGGSSPERIAQSEQTNIEKLHTAYQTKNPENLYQTDHTQVAEQAHQSSLGQEQPVDISLMKNTEQNIAERGQEINRTTQTLTREKEELNQKTTSNQKKLREDTALIPHLNINKIDSEK